MQKLQLVGMADYARKPTSKLSGGQQQRVAITRAMANDPTIIMGNEPTGNLDKANTNNVFSIFRDLAAQGQTIIAVTHDPDFAAGTDRIIEMSDGQIVKAQEPLVTVSIRLAKYFLQIVINTNIRRAIIPVSIANRTSQSCGYK